MLSELIHLELSYTVKKYVLFVSKCASKTLLFRFRAGSLTADTNGGGCILGAPKDELLRDRFLPFI